VHADPHLARDKGDILDWQAHRADIIGGGRTADKAPPALQLRLVCSTWAGAIAPAKFAQRAALSGGTDTPASVWITGFIVPSGL